MRIGSRSDARPKAESCLQNPSFWFSKTTVPDASSNPKHEHLLLIESTPIAIRASRSFQHTYYRSIISTRECQSDHPKSSSSRDIKKAPQKNADRGSHGLAKSIDEHPHHHCYQDDHGTDSREREEETTPNFPPYL